MMSRFRPLQDKEPLKEILLEDLVKNVDFPEPMEHLAKKEEGEEEEEVDEVEDSYSKKSEAYDEIDTT